MRYTRPTKRCTFTIVLAIIWAVAMTGYVAAALGSDVGEWVRQGHNKQHVHNCEEGK